MDEAVDRAEIAEWTRLVQEMKLPITTLGK